jgi:hypothetical protein
MAAVNEQGAATEQKGANKGPTRKEGLFVCLFVCLNVGITV